jgi:hypothetical protein
VLSVDGEECGGVGTVREGVGFGGWGEMKWFGMYLYLYMSDDLLVLYVELKLDMTWGRDKIVGSDEIGSSARLGSARVGVQHRIELSLQPFTVRFPNIVNRYIP